MCQLAYRCKVDQHREGTFCRVAKVHVGRGWWNTPRSSLPPAPAARPPVSHRPARPHVVPRGEPAGMAPVSEVAARRGGSVAAAATAALSIVDILILLAVLRGWKSSSPTPDLWQLALVVALIAAPFLLAKWLCKRCAAWNTTKDGRCAKVRRGFLRRCSEIGHEKQWLVAPDVGAAACCIVGILGVVMLCRAIT